MGANPIKCFVAMPFGKPDCDAIYDKQILPVLRGLNILPIRVDRREHKEDLNVYIVRMLNESDMALADLTYARPSVYYEAGYADCKMPVVYTVRKDHLSRAQADENLRVHFDLEMKNIVHWRDVDDPTFAERLRKRVSFFIKPLCQQREKDELLERDRETFTSQSVKTRIKEIERQFIKSLMRRRFWTSSLLYMHREFAERFLPGRVLFGAKLVNKTCYFCAFIIVDALTKKHIQSAVNWLDSNRLISSDYEIENYQDYFIFLSLHKYLESRFTSILPDAAPCGASGTYLISYRPYLMPNKKQKGIIELPKPSQPQRSKTIKIVSPIDTNRRLLKEAKNIMANFPKEKDNRYAYLILGDGLFYKGWIIYLSRKRAPRKGKTGSADQIHEGLRGHSRTYKEIRQR